MQKDNEKLSGGSKFQQGKLAFVLLLVLLNKQSQQGEHENENHIIYSFRFRTPL